MKQLGILLLLLIVISCGNKRGGTEFNPQEKKDVFASDEERQNSIEKLRAKIDSAQIDFQTLMSPDNIKLSVLPPAPQGEITLDVSKFITMRLMQVLTQNGIGGIGNSPIVLAAALSPIKKSATGTAPQKMMVNYKVTFLVANTITGETFTTLEQEISGAGNSFEEASMNAANEIKNNDNMQQMLTIASKKILAWYNGNISSFKAVVEKLVAEREYSAAFALLSSVPKEATGCYTYANKHIGSVLEEMKNQEAEETLIEMKNEIAAAGNKYNPSIAAYMRLLPANSKQMREATQLFEKYNRHLKEFRSDSIAHARKIELENMATERLKIQYGMKSTMSLIDKAASSPSGSFVNETEEKSEGGIKGSIKKHPLLWGLGTGAVLTGVGAIALYSSLPMLTKFGLALL